MEMELPSFIEPIKEVPPVILGVAAAVIVLLLIGLRLIFRKPPSHLTAFAGAEGSVLVSRKALQELIKQTCMKDDGVEAARPSVKINGEKVNTRVDLRLASPENLKETSERLQDRISGLLRKSLNFDQLGEIQIVVSSFKSDSDTTPTAETSPPRAKALEEKENSSVISPE